MNKIRDGKTLKELKSNDTANQLVGEVFKENYQIHNNFVSHFQLFHANYFFLVVL